MQYIFIHGLGQSSSSWNDTLMHLEKNDQVICLDLSLFLKEDEATYVNLCGLSLGAVLALTYTINNPEKVKSLVLIAGQYKMPKVLLKLQNVIFRCIPKNAFTNMGIKKNDVIRLTNSMTNLNFSDNLEDISCPVLVLCGEKDTANKTASKKLAESIKQAHLQFVKAAKHEVNVDAPEALAKLLNNFYTK